MAILDGFVLLFALLWAHPGLEVPNFERCWGWCCCKLRLVSGACHALGPNADFALLCSDGLPLKPPVLIGPFSFSASFFCGFVCCAVTLLSKGDVETQHGQVEMSSGKCRMGQ